MAPVEDSVDADFAENTSKNDGTETKRPKRQAAAVDKVKVIDALHLWRR